MNGCFVLIVCLKVSDGGLYKMMFLKNLVGTLGCGYESK